MLSQIQDFIHFWTEGSLSPSATLCPGPRPILFLGTVTWVVGVSSASCLMPVVPQTGVGCMLSSVHEGPFPFSARAVSVCLPSGGSPSLQFLCPHLGSGCEAVAQWGSGPWSCGDQWCQGPAHLLAICTPSFEKDLFESFAHFSTGLFFFLLMSC